MKSFIKKLSLGLASLVLAATFSCKSTKSIIEDYCNTLNPSEYTPTVNGCYGVHSDTNGNKLHSRHICCYIHNPDAGDYYYKDINGDYRDEIIVEVKKALACSNGEYGDCAKEIYAYDKNRDDFNMIFFAGARRMSINSDKTNGYNNIDVFSSNGRSTTFIWDASKKKYMPK